MPLPKPELGLVVHYAFVWAGPGRTAPPHAGKHRPCLIVDLEDVLEPAARGGRITRVTYLRIFHTPPRKGEHAIAIPSRVATHLSLTTAASFLYTSYAVEDDWPFDLVARPGPAGRFDCGLLPPRLFAAVAQAFAAQLAARPRLLHRRDV